MSSEGRAQRFYQVFVPEGDIQASWQWLRDVMAAAGRQEGTAWKHIDDVIAAMATAIPALAQVQQAAPAASFRIAGRESTTRAGTLQRTHGHAGEHQRARAQAAG